VQKQPLLSADEELSLARRWADHGDTEASDRLANSHLRLVIKIAMGYRGYGLPVDFLGQTMKAEVGNMVTRTGMLATGGAYSSIMIESFTSQSAL